MFPNTVTYFWVRGEKYWGNMIKAKKAIPVVSRVMGVIRAATPQPKRSKILLLAAIMSKVKMPVTVEKLPMNAEYVFGSGKAAFSLLFQVTSTMLIAMP